MKLQITDISVLYLNVSTHEEQGHIIKGYIISYNILGRNVNDEHYGKICFEKEALPENFTFQDIRNLLLAYLVDTLKQEIK